MTWRMVMILMWSEWYPALVAVVISWLMSLSGITIRHAQTKHIQSTSANIHSTHVSITVIGLQETTTATLCLHLSERGRMLIFFFFAGGRGEFLQIFLHGCIKEKPDLATEGGRVNCFESLSVVNEPPKLSDFQMLGVLRFLMFLHSVGNVRPFLRSRRGAMSRLVSRPKDWVFWHSGSKLSKLAESKLTSAPVDGKKKKRREDRDKLPQTAAATAAGVLPARTSTWPFGHSQHPGPTFSKYRQTAVGDFSQISPSWFEHVSSRAKGRH